MRINVRKLIEQISRYDYINYVTLISAAEEVETLERIEKENRQYQESLKKKDLP